MYILTLLLPLLGSIFSGLIGRKLGVTGSQLITTSSLGLASILSILAFYEISLSGSPVTLNLNT
jgi:NADH-ubiquinone oxidoreductase chain 5